MFAGDPDPYTDDSDRKDMHALMVTPSAGVTAHVGETAKGGPPDNHGDSHRTGNHAPVVKAPANRTVPLRTPFTLRGSATDADGDALTYLWEQNDTGGTSGTRLVDNAKKNGPLFRVFGRYADVSTAADLESPAAGENLAGTSPSRTFPDLAQILAGDTNARTGRCPAPPHQDPNQYVPVPLPIRELLLGVPADQGLRRHRTLHDTGDALPADRARLRSRRRRGAATTT